MQIDFSADVKLLSSMTLTLYCLSVCYWKCCVLIIFVGTIYSLSNGEGKTSGHIPECVCVSECDSTVGKKNRIVKYINHTLCFTGTSMLHWLLRSGTILLTMLHEIDHVTNDL